MVVLDKVRVQDKFLMNTVIYTSPMRQLACLYQVLSVRRSQRESRRGYTYATSKLSKEYHSRSK